MCDRRIDQTLLHLCAGCYRYTYHRYSTTTIDYRLTKRTQAPHAVELFIELCRVSPSAATWQPCCRLAGVLGFSAGHSRRHLLNSYEGNPHPQGRTTSHVSPTYVFSQLGHGTLYTHSDVCSNSSLSFGCTKGWSTSAMRTRKPCCRRETARCRCKF